MPNFPDSLQRACSRCQMLKPKKGSAQLNDPLTLLEWIQGDSIVINAFQQICNKIHANAVLKITAFQCVTRR